MYIILRLERCSLLIHSVSELRTSFQSLLWFQINLQARQNIYWATGWCLGSSWPGLSLAWARTCPLWPALTSRWPDPALSLARCRSACLLSGHFIGYFVAKEALVLALITSVIWIINLFKNLHCFWPSEKTSLTLVMTCIWDADCITSVKSVHSTFTIIRREDIEDS